MVDSNLLGSTEDFLITKKHFSECLVLLDTISLGIQVKKCMTDFLSIYLLIIGWSLTKLSFLCGSKITTYQILVIGELQQSFRTFGVVLIHIFKQIKHLFKR
jgi:hypothetical protein